MAERDQKNAPQGGGDAGAGPQGPQEDALLARLRATGGGGGHPLPMTCLVGILGQSARPGYWTLYLGLDMSRYVEIRAEDIVLSEALPPDKSPFGSLGGTRVCVKKGAALDYS